MAGNGWRGWKGLEWLGMAKHCWKLLEIAGNGWKLLKWMDNLKWLEMAEHGWKWLDIARMARNN